MVILKPTRRMHPIRDKIISKLTFLKDKTKSAELEAAIYEYVSADARSHNIPVDNDNKLFVSLYQSKARHILVNLDPSAYIKNMYLLERYINKQISTEQLIHMKAREMFPDMWKEYSKKEDAEADHITKGDLVAITDLYTCNKCKNKKCSIVQEQTRSADEGITNKLTCLSCGHKWNIHN